MVLDVVVVVLDIIVVVVLSSPNFTASSGRTFIGSTKGGGGVNDIVYVVVVLIITGLVGVAGGTKGNPDPLTTGNGSVGNGIGGTVEFSGRNGIWFVLL